MTDARSAIVRIWSGAKARNFLGSGFLISGRCVVTCHHVIKDCNVEELSVDGPGFYGGRRRVSHIKSHSTLDIATLAIDQPTSDTPPALSIGRLASKPAKQSEILVLGFADADGDLVEMNVRVISVDGNTSSVVAQSRMAPGMSGSAAFFNDTLWGVLYSRGRERDACFIIPLDSAPELFEGFEEFNSSPPNDTRDVFDREIDLLWPPLFPTFRLENWNEFEGVGNFFRYVLTSGSGNEQPRDVLRSLIETVTRSSGSVMLYLSGGQGTGKSTALLVVSEALRFQRKEGSRLLPVFIDTDKYLKLPPPSDIAEAMEEDFEKLKSLLAGNPDRVVLVIDGLSLDNPHVEPVLNRVFGTIRKERLQAIVASVPDGLRLKLDQLLETLSVKLERLEYRLTPYQLHQRSDDDFLSEYARFFAKLRGEAFSEGDIGNRARLLKDKLRDFGLSSVDMHLASIMLSKVNDPAYEGRSNVADFMERYCAERLRALGANPDEIFLPPSKLAHLLLVEAMQRKENVQRLPIPRDQALAWLFVREHTNHRDFLAAWYIVRVLCASTADSDSRMEITEGRALAYDYPESVNFFVKRIVNSSDDKQNKVFSAVSGLHGRVDEITRKFFYYLLGRFERRGAREKAKQLLNGVKSELLGNMQAELPAELPEGRGDYFMQLTLLRTVYISLINLYDKPALDEYVEQLLSLPDVAAVNRGFHRIYYGDPGTTGQWPDEIYNDQGTESWERTWEALSAKIETHLAVTKDNVVDSDVLFELHVFTVASFAQSRFIHDALTDAQRHKVRSLLGDCAARVENARLRAYLRALLLDLGRPTFSRWDFIVDLYELKTTARSGWVKRRVGPDKKDDVESIADHTHLLCLLAWFLLPEDLEDHAYYDKRKILEMLLVHDIAEAFTRDHVVVEFDEQERQRYSENEAAAMQYIRMKDTYPGIFGAASAYDRWREFEDPPVTDDGSDINASLAKDMDRFENFVQLQLYREKVGAAQHDAFRESLLAGFQTEIVNDLARDFDNWCRRQGAGPRKRFAEFDFPKIPLQQARHGQN